MKLAIGMCWYDGPDVTCAGRFMDFMTYLGELRDRTLWRKQLGHDKFTELEPNLPLLDAGSPDAEAAQPTALDYLRLGELEIGLIDYTRTSLVGKARELTVETALKWEADYLFMWDDDMKFEHSTFLRLLRHDVPVVAALAFTSREPFHPVIMTIKESTDSVTGQPMMTSEYVLDYPKDKLITNEDVGGLIAFGTGVFLCNMSVFKQVPQPWFESTGAGEDFFFCTKCHQHGVDRYVDTATKTSHKKWTSDFIDEKYYDKFRELNTDLYKKHFAELNGDSAND